jgi:hypothetical protein
MKEDIEGKDPLMRPESGCRTEDGGEESITRNKDKKDGTRQNG